MAFLWQLFFNRKIKSFFFSRRILYYKTKFCDIFEEYVPTTETKAREKYFSITNTSIGRVRGKWGRNCENILERDSLVSQVDFTGEDGEDIYLLKRIRKEETWAPRNIRIFKTPKLTLWEKETFLEKRDVEKTEAWVFEIDYTSFKSLFK